MQHAILTAIGADRPGLVEEVSQFIFEHGGNIEDSRMVNLRGQFAMMVLLGARDDVIARIRRDLPRLAEKSRLHTELRPASAAPAEGQRPAAVGRAFQLKASAMDQAGLVHRVAHLLRAMNVNIESLETHLSAAPISGAPVFEMELTLSVPHETPLGGLRDQLGKLCDELNIDWVLTAV